MSVKLDYVEYEDDGTISIRGNRDGFPQITGACPAPDIRGPPEERQRQHKEAIENLNLKGYIVVSWRYIHNEAFDGLNQKTTLEVTARPCKNKEEMARLGKKIKTILRERHYVEEVRA